MQERFNRWLSYLSNTVESWTQFKLGIFLAEQGDLNAAVESYNKAVHLTPNYPDIHYRLGNALLEQGEHNAAIESYKAAIKHRSNFPEAHNNLGVVLQEKGNLDAAISSYKTASKLRFNFPEVYLNLGLAFKDKGNISAAIDSYKISLQQRPESSETHNHLGIAFQEQGDINEAIDSFKASLKIDCGFQPARSNLFQAFVTTERYEEAIKEYQLLDKEVFNPYLEAVTLQLMYQCLLRLNRYEEAIALANNRNDRRLQLINRLHVLPILYSNDQQLETVRRRWGHDALELYDLLENIEQSDPAWESLYGHVWVINNFQLAYQMDNDRPLQELYAGILDRILRPRLGTFMEPRPHREPLHNRPLRVGVISDNLRNHNGSIWCLGWLKGIAGKPGYEIFTYNTGNRIDSGTMKFASLGMHRDLNIQAENPEQSLQQILDDELDLLIHTDIGMNAKSKVISVLQLAPVQVQGWGHPITSGSRTIQYFLSGEGMEQKNSETHYSETLLRLPRTGLNYETPESILDGQQLFEKFQLPRDRPIITSLQSTFKYVPRNDYTFAEISKCHPKALILMVDFAKGGHISNFLYERLRPHFEKRGLEIEQHLRILPRLTHEDYMGLFAIGHHTLDTIDWNGGNSSMQSFSLDCPVVTLPTDFMRGRHTVSMLKVLEIPELIANDRNDYIQISCRLLGDQVFYNNIKERIHKQKIHLFNDKAIAEAFRKNVEKVCRRTTKLD